MIGINFCFTATTCVGKYNNVRLKNVAKLDKLVKLRGD